MMHRDLKPENIFIDIKQPKVNQSEQVITAKIGDFGLACMVGRDKQDEFSEINSPIILNENELTLARTTSFQSNNSKRNVFSSIGGTEAYMAPEIMKHYL